MWETLAILEYVNELFPDSGLWPSDRDARARAVANEMHAGFAALHNHMPMNLRRGDLDPAPAVAVLRKMIVGTADFVRRRRLDPKVAAPKIV